MASNELKVPEQIAVWERVMRQPAYQRSAPDAQLAKLIQAPLSSGFRALDLGCGWGRHLIWLAELGWRVTGLDWSQVAVKNSREALESKGLFGQVIKGDCRKLPFSNSEFHLVLATEVLNHGRLADFKRALGEIKRVLRVNCQAVFNVPTIRNMPQPFKGIWVEETTVVMSAGVEAGLPHHFFTEEEVRRSARQFRSIEIETVIVPLPDGVEPLHDKHINEWMWVTLTG